MRDPSWETVEELLASAASGGRLELYSADELTILTVEAHGGAFQVSVQVGQVRHLCLRPGAAGSQHGIVDLGPFAFNAAEVCRQEALVLNVVREFWAEGTSSAGTAWTWKAYETENALSPLNDSMAKAAAEVGALLQAYNAGNRGGPASLRVKGPWNASPATRADMKLLGRWMELASLSVTDADGSARTFVGNELLPTARGGKPW